MLISSLEFSLLLPSLSSSRSVVAGVLGTPFVAGDLGARVITGALVLVSLAEFSLQKLQVFSPLSSRCSAQIDAPVACVCTGSLVVERVADLVAVILIARIVGAALDAEMDYYQYCIYTSRTNFAESVRVSTYPERVRTPVWISLVANLEKLPLACASNCKAIVGQCDTSGDTLDAFIASGSSFQDILKNRWEQFRQHIKGRVVKTDGTWSPIPLRWIIGPEQCSLEQRAFTPAPAPSTSTTRTPTTTRNESSTSQISGKLNHESTHLNVVDERTNPDSNNKILPRARAPATRTSPTTRVPELNGRQLRWRRVQRAEHLLPELQ
ncbi:hypothetical protein GQ600_20251 [Phytophthora cactorum]|nr:hypothetical protein GQ600_20251 [Phytophthora cactorum]